MAPFGVSTTKSDPPGECDKTLSGPGCPYEGYTYTVPSAPFYVKVFSHVYDAGSSTPYGTPWPKDYTFRWQRSNCEESTQACVILPTQVYKATWEKNASDKKYFQFYVDRSDAGLPQTLRFDAKVAGPSVWLRSISVRNQNDVQVGAADSTPAGYGSDWRWQLFSANNTSDPSESVGYLDNDQALYYLVVEKNASLPPQDFDFEVRWDTNLAWIHGATHSWPGTTDWGLALHGETQDDCHYPLCKTDDEIEIRYEGDNRDYTAFGRDTTYVGAWQGNFANDQGWTSLTITGSPYQNITNVYGEPVSIRDALRVVDHFGLQIREDDGMFNGAADLSGGAYFYPLTPASSLGAGVPDPATADKYTPNLQSSGTALYLEDDEGKYEARMNVTAALLTHFCLHGADQCGKSGKYCCDSTSLVCLDKPPAPNAGGYCQ